MSSFKDQVAETEGWMNRPRFREIRRLYSARQVVRQRGTIRNAYPIAETAAEQFHAHLRELFAAGKSITTFGPYSPGQAVAMKRMGIEGIYLGGWATSAKGSISEDPGPDLASYPLSQVPDEAAVLVRALLTADKNQTFMRLQMTDEQREATSQHDFRPFIIADADTGHGGDAHVRNLIRRFVEVGVPGYHIEDQRPGSKKCGHQGGKVLVPEDEQIKRLNAARFQLDIMGVAGIIVARTDAESATLLESNSDERDQPFILGATNVNLPSYKTSYLAVLKKFYEAGVEELNGHLLYAVSDEEFSDANEWLRSVGVTETLEKSAAAYKKNPEANVGALLDKVVSLLVEEWQTSARLKTYAHAVADVMQRRRGDGESFDMTVEEWNAFATKTSLYAAKSKANSMGLHVTWDCECARTPEGYYQIEGGIDFAIAKSLAAAPFADLLWMETKTADLKDAKQFADAIHAEFPNQMMAYNLSPSFSWDTTGMTDDEMRAFPEELGKLGFVFNFITYGGHQIDGLASEEFALALRQEGMLALARLQRKFRLLESAYKTPQTMVGGPRMDAALTASSGRTATTKAMGLGSTQHQHLVQTEVPPSLLQEWLAIWTEHYDYSTKLRVHLRPNRAGSDLLELSVLGKGDEKIANVVFTTMRDRRGRLILSIRDQNTFELASRKKRLMLLLHLFLIHRYGTGTVHYVSPNEDNHAQTLRMKDLGIYSDVNYEVGEIIVTEVDSKGVATLLESDHAALEKLIKKSN